MFRELSDELNESTSLYGFGSVPYGHCEEISSSRDNLAEGIGARPGYLVIVIFVCLEYCTAPTIDNHDSIVLVFFYVFDFEEVIDAVTIGRYNVNDINNNFRGGDDDIKTALAFIL